MPGCVINQFAKDVTDFSSQYGSDGSISYVANNVIGKPCLYPEYGDFSAAYSMRTYGNWWEHCSSAAEEIAEPPSLLVPTVDFIDVKFECAVFPVRIDIYETYHPGSVVRIWGSLEGHHWTLLWKGTPTPWKGARTEQPEARIFTAPVNSSDKLIDMLRLEFDQRQQDYYSAIDAILLVGSTHTATTLHVPLDCKTLYECVMKLGFHETAGCEKDILMGAKFLLYEDNLQKLIEEPIPSGVREEKEEKNEEEMSVHNLEKEMTQVDVIERLVEEDTDYWELLPEELILHIMRLLDLQSLCRLAQASKRLHKYALDPILYIKLNLKNYWWMTDNSALECLAPRACLLQELDLSWCGPYNALDTETFMEFIHQSGRQLRVLRVNSCHFIDNYCLYIIANVCPDLQELSMANCSKVDNLGFGELKKVWQLSRLDLSRTRIDLHTLQLLLQHASNLRHLNLSNCMLLDMDEVALTLATFNRQLVSLGAWKTHGLSNRGLRALACVPTLEDLDLGWALSGVVTEGLGELARGCRNLKRLYLTALRTLTDHDLLQLATHAGQLQQLDIMGTRNVSADVVLRVLQNCTKLELLDVSFCEQLHSTFVQQCALQYPNVCLKGGMRHSVHLI
ncbi:F-box/LRR-repeat protein 4-like [Oratosquilla oratoria]|uniref:F-box/LRR-repeat protein 4-like n=1 Tax=Oratosquilla oratoria TaxID=337810 RepID=UPI003F759185